jgi:hypothetical protein
LAKDFLVECDEVLYEPFFEIVASLCEQNVGLQFDR